MFSDARSLISNQLAQRCLVAVFLTNMFSDVVHEVYLRMASFVGTEGCEEMSLAWHDLENDATTALALYDKRKRLATALIRVSNAKPKAPGPKAPAPKPKAKAAA